MIRNIQHLFGWLEAIFATGGGIAAIRFAWVTDGMKDMRSGWAVPLGAFVFSAVPLAALFRLLSRPLVEQDLFVVCSCVLLLASCVIFQSISFARRLRGGSATGGGINSSNRTMELTPARRTTQL